jgi:hypothetical protein
MSDRLAWRASPPCEGKGNASEVECAEDELVVLGEPVRLEIPILSLYPGLRQRCVAPEV